MEEQVPEMRASKVGRSVGDSVERHSSTTLPDGRALMYSELGMPGGPVVMYFHGAPGSRLDLVVFADAFAALGVRVISPDRPGFGGSSPQPERRREDWPADVAALADDLAVDRFAVMGASSGGPYALACAAMLPTRVTSVGVVCGEGDFGWPDAWNGYPDDDEAALMRIGDEERAAAWCETRYGPSAADAFLGRQLTELPPADDAALADETLASALMTTVGEAFRQGVRGYAQDVVVQGQAWAFDPGRIVASVRILHGDSDTLTPVAHARHTAEVIPGAKLVIRPGHGHISILTEIPQLAADLADALHSTPGRT
jgi:pimeloyl-ACP methyl ester carboxylesterase